jgi:hypothetical protein
MDLGYITLPDINLSQLFLESPPHKSNSCKPCTKKKEGGGLGDGLSDKCEFYF